MEDAVHLEEVAQIGITVRDLPRAKHFYGTILSMQFLFDAGTMAFFQCGALRLMIGLAEAGKPFVAAGTILYFRVQNIQKTHALLETHGVAFIAPPHLVAPMPNHDLWMAFLNDPDDNPLALMSEVPRVA